MDLTVLNPAPPPPKPTANSPRKKLYIGLGIAAGIAAFVGLVLVAIVSVKGVKRAFEEPMTALNIYTDCLINKDFKNAYAIAAPELRENTTLEQMIEFHNSLTVKYGALKSAKQQFWNFVTENGITSVRIQAQLHFERGDVPFQFVLRKQNNVWRVFSYKVLTQAGLGQN